MDKFIIKAQILEYMSLHCKGFRKAKPRKEICDELVLEDRLFREICEDLKTEGHIATNSQDGYYFIPLVIINDPQEIEALKHSINDKRSRAIKLLQQAKKMAEHLEKKVNRQAEFAR